ncbi:serine hydrolase [Lysinibacter cavernae]|uniref:Beta-lactamase class A n=1 Tax=Lysinibacter cavernae TaxID=1640652 RepID=A0A7X5R445_9MICO|nr:serine hydrolase [Lysinibacter cavernae]NIH55007.1 beta-lactamase class A [Lysinibacter cavernae]
MSKTPPPNNTRRFSAHSPLLLGGLSVALAAILVITVAFIANERALTLASGTTSAGSEQTQAAEEPSARSSALDSLVHDFVSEYPQSAVVIVDLGDASTAEANGDVPFTSASLYKLFVAYDVLSEVDAGEYTLDDWMPEVETTIGDCLDVMITYSDNDCGAALGTMVDWATLDQRLANEGYSQTILNNYDEFFDLDGDKITTANDVTLLLSRLVAGELLSPQSSELFLTLLSEQTLNYALPTGLDDSLSFAHKTGLLDEVSHDAGIVSAPAGTFIVVLLTDGWDDAADESPALFTEFGERFSALIRDWA